MHAVLHHSSLPKHLWGEATLFATWLKNRTSTWALGNITPYERLHGQKPNLAGVPEWGQRVWVHTDAGSKLDGRAIEGQVRQEQYSCPQNLLAKQELSFSRAKCQIRIDNGHTQ